MTDEEDKNVPVDSDDSTQVGIESKPESNDEVLGLVADPSSSSVIGHLDDAWVPTDYPEQLSSDFLLGSAMARPPENYTQWRIDGIIGYQSVSLLVAPSQSGKSFLALDMASCIGAGYESWGGHRINNPDGGYVLYMIGEGEHEYRNRFAAWVQEHGEIDKLKNIGFFNVVDMTADNIEELTAKVLAPLRKLFGTKDNPDDETKLKLSMVIIDNVNCFMSGDENRSVTVKNFYQSCRTISREFECSVLAVHNITTKKAGKTWDELYANGPRGSSIFIDDFSTVMYLEKDEKTSTPEQLNVTLKCAKQRDGVLFDPISFKLCKVDLVPSGFPSGTSSLCVTYDPENQTLTSTKKSVSVSTKHTGKKATKKVRKNAIDPENVFRHIKETWLQNGKSLLGDKPSVSIDELRTNLNNSDDINSPAYIADKKNPPLRRLSAEGKIEFEGDNIIILEPPKHKA